MYVVSMIVKNEAATIALTLASLQRTLPLRAVVIHDTGSSDGTQDICREHGALVTDVPWVDFSTNRNQALRDAERHVAEGDVLLMISAGALLSGDPALPDPGSGSAWKVRYTLGSTTYYKPMVFVPGKGWGFTGRVHECVTTPPGESVAQTPCKLTMDFCLRDDARPARWHRDLALLEDDYTPRGRFYYAQSLQLTGDPARAFFWYLHRGARSEGWNEERCQAYIRAIPLAPSYDVARWCCGRALEIDGNRGEAWLQFALYAASCAKTPQEWQVVGIAAGEALARVPKPTDLFVDTDREWKARELIARAAFWAGRKIEARALWMQVLDDAPEYAHLQIRENLKFCDD
jgi:hypothetical protein